MITGGKLICQELRKGIKLIKNHNKVLGRVGFEPT